MIKKPKYKIARRLGAGVFDKCQTPKFAASVARKTKTSTKRPKPLSEYGQQLIEKQKIRFSYGITERQLSNYVKEASANKGTSIQEKLFETLESRLDNVIYRLGLAHTRRFARQMISHGHFVVNGVRTTVPSYRIKIGDIVTVRGGSKASPMFANVAEKMKSYKHPAWLTLDQEKIEGSVTGKPKNTEGFLNLGSVLEFYSR
jgi:small subunit ribosomal protein S4